MAAPWLIVGLGNPGRDYSRNRHNLGFRCIDYLAKANKIALKERTSRARIGRGNMDDIPVVLAKPLTYMNLSGRAVVGLLAKFPGPLEKLLVIYDDLDLPLGRMRLRGYGGSGGHKGMQSIISSLGKEDFPRLRLGIGRPPLGQSPEDYVLQDFASEEGQVKEMLPRAAQAVLHLLHFGLEAAMNRLNSP